MLLRHILMLDDTPHSIALGTAIGMSIGLSPTVGIQMILVVAIAALTRRLFHFNRIAALLTIYISNPVTMAPIYWSLYKVGTFFVGGDLNWEDFARIVEYHGLRHWWETNVTLFIKVGEPLIVGTFIVATTGGALTYPLMRWLLRSFHAARWVRRPAPDPEKEAASSASE